MGGASRSSCSGSIHVAASGKMDEEGDAVFVTSFEGLIARIAATAIIGSKLTLPTTLADGMKPHRILPPSSPSLLPKCHARRPFSTNLPPPPCCPIRKS